jgi:hypothetical protein
MPDYEYPPAGNLPQNPNQRVMSGHGKGTSLFVPSKCSILRAAVGDHRGIFSGPLDMGLINNKGMQREQGKDLG